MLKGYRQKARKCAFIGFCFSIAALYSLILWAIIEILWGWYPPQLIADISGVITAGPAAVFFLLAWYYWATGHGYPASNLFGLLLWQNLDDEYPEEEEPS
jgi:hypothetical protein